VKNRTITVTSKNAASAFQPVMDFASDHDITEMIIRGRPNPKAPRVKYTKTATIYYKQPRPAVEQLTIKLDQPKVHRRVHVIRAPKPN